jgi:ABC-type glycerol-3-phosphate transport system substrate-binding protein
MKRISYTAMVALAFVTLLAGCGSSSNGSAPSPPPPPPPPLAPLVWDQANWDEVVWQ